MLPETVSNQAFIFLYSIMGGILIAFIYDIFRIKRKAIRTTTLLVCIEDFLFWIIVALVMFGTLYYSNQGELRGYIFLGTVLGVILYVITLSRLVITVSLAVLNFSGKCFRLIFKLLFFPFKIIFIVFRVPVLFSWRFTVRTSRKFRRIARPRIARARIWRRLFKNIRKKI